MKYAIFVAIAALLTACGPSNYADCLTEASKAPTEQGTRLAAAACIEKFPQR